MAFNLKALGTIVVVAMGIGAIGASSAAAEETLPAVFTANVGAGETAKGDGSQIGTALFTIPGLPAVTCTTVSGHGEALELGPEFKKLRAFPEFSGCHVVLAGLTKLVTVTTNGCSSLSEAATTESGEFTANVTVECPVGKKIEIHVYGGASSETSTLCTYDISPQGPLTPKGTITNKTGTPNDVEIEASVETQVTNTIQGGVCGSGGTVTATSSGKGTVRGTNEFGEFVNVSISG